MCLPKDRGGLGFKRLEDWNNACLFKIAWNLSACPNDLWVQVFRGKYVRESDWDRQIIVNNSDSLLWKSLSKIWKFKIERQAWSLENGQKASFRRDGWLDGERLIEYCSRTIPGEWENQPMEFFTYQNGSWDINKIQDFLKLERLHLLLAHHPPIKEAGNDCLN